MDTDCSTAEITGYTRMLRKALNISWQEHSTNNNVYGKLPLVSSKIKSRRMRIAGHCIRHPELSTHPYGNPHKAKLIEVADD